MPEPQVVEPAVTRRKFDREVDLFWSVKAANRRRGILLKDVSFPMVTVAFGSQLRPTTILDAVRLDFTDYNLQPPSVRFVDPLTHEDIVAKDLTVQMLRLPRIEGMDRAAIVMAVQQGALRVQAPNLIQFDGPDAVPFICMPGVREYHDNPAHTGDAWLLHRASGEGCLAFIVDNIWKYGVNPIERFLVQANAEGEDLRAQVQIETRRIGLSVPLASMPH